MGYVYRLVLRGYCPLGDNDYRLDEVMTTLSSEQLIEQLRKRAEIRRGLATPIQNRPDLLADILEEAATALSAKEAEIQRLGAALETEEMLHQATRELSDYHRAALEAEIKNKKEFERAMRGPPSAPLLPHRKQPTSR